MGECLFPMNNQGEIVFTDNVSMDGLSVSEINNSVRTYINKFILRNGVDKKESAESESNLIYKLTVPVGKQQVTLEYWGAPVFAFARDASKVTFMLEINIKDGMFKYRLTDFWTSRRMIRGEGKNNGPSNLIHWQRVNSISKERDTYLKTHNSEKRSTKEDLFDYDMSIKYEQNQYAKEYAVISEFVKGFNSVKKTNPFEDAPEEVSSIQKTDNSTSAIDLSSYHGNLLAKGNSVYISVNPNKQYELGGFYELYKQIIVDSIWRVAETPEQAHFIIDYIVDLEGRDKAILRIRDTENKNQVDLCKTGTSESYNENKEVARSMYKSHILPIIQQLEKGKTPKNLKVFER